MAHRCAQRRAISNYIELYKEGGKSGFTYGVKSPALVANVTSKLAVGVKAPTANTCGSPILKLERQCACHCICCCVCYWVC